MDPELLMISVVLIVIALVAYFVRSRFLVQLAGGALAISILWNVGRLKGWLMDSKAAAVMYITASLFGFILGLIVVRGGKAKVRA